MLYLYVRHVNLHSHITKGVGKFAQPLVSLLHLKCLETALVKEKQKINIQPQIHKHYKDRKSVV